MRTRVVTLVLSLSPLLAWASPLPLDYNWNALVHSGEMGMPDNPDGYRSISDRGLTVEVDVNSLPSAVTGNTGLDYELNTSPFEVDSVFLGLRRTWDSAPDPDEHGIQPSWDPTGGTAEVSSLANVLGAPLLAESDFALGFLYNISNGGGTFDVSLDFDGEIVTVTLAAPDWFGAPPVPVPGTGVATQARLDGPVGGVLWGGVEVRDRADFGPALNLVEATVTADSLLAGLGFDVTGRTLTAIGLGNLTGIDTELREGALGLYAASVSGASRVEVPEPGALALLGLGLLGAGLARKRR